MGKREDYYAFLEAKEQCIENIQKLRSALIQCVDEKRIDMEESLYDQTFVCLDGAPLLESWEELESLISEAKILEGKIDAWLSVHELTSYSLVWPKRSS